MKPFSCFLLLFSHVAILPKSAHSQVCEDDETFSSSENDNFNTDCSNCGGEEFCKNANTLKRFCRTKWKDDARRWKKRGSKWCKKTCDSVSGSCSEDICPEIYSQPSNYEKKACNEVIFPSRASTIPNTPSSWQKTNCFANSNAEAVYDLALIGAGIGAAYVGNELRFGHAHNHTIAVFEAGDNVGGRLMSAFQAGALGIPVRPFDLETNVAPPEYGGMRIATKYKLVFKQIILLWQRYFKDDSNAAQCTLHFCKSPKNPKNCCKGLLTPMDVGNVAYFNTRKDLGSTLLKSSLTDKNPLYGNFKETYTLAHIEKYEEYPPFVQCILLVVGVNQYTNETKGIGNMHATEGFKKACSKNSCNKVSPKFCGLCDLFPEPAAAAVSCSGYDINPDVTTTDFIIGLTDEVVNVEGKTFLYLFTVGYQRLVQELFSGTMSGDAAFGEGHNQYNTIDLAPQFRKKLIAVGVGRGNFGDAVKRARTLAKNQKDRYRGKLVEVYNGTTGPIRLKFEDGSVTTSHMAYLTMLPYDAVDKVEGLEPWAKIVHNATEPVGLFKGVIAWDTFSLAKELRLKPCVRIKNETARGGPCDRIILDGDPSSQVVRQAWLWDYKQILIYQVGGDGTPCGNDIDLSTKFGMEVFVEKVVAELQVAVNQYNITIPPPAWFRMKSWPIKSVVTWDVNDPVRLSEYFRRPFGSDVPVWYGNSEMSADDNLHGWAEGALSMANISLPELKTELGLL